MLCADVIAARSTGQSGCGVGRLRIDQIARAAPSESLSHVPKGQR
jgi:hypothetical protein